MCRLPSIYMDVYQHGAATCCPAWNKVGIFPSEDPLGMWDSEEFRKVREMVQDEGSCLSYCKSLCISAARFSGGHNPPQLKILRVSFDRTCNLQCPACRREIEVTDSEYLKKMYAEIERRFGQTLEEIQLLGLGDPIASPVTRQWLLDFKQERFPKLRKIHLHTNAQLLTEEFWNSLPEDTRRNIRSIGISIDAATKESYEKIRKGGKWDVLQTNLKFFSTLPGIVFEFYFVVQQDNYLEIKQFYEMLVRLFGVNKIRNIVYQQVLQWTDDETFQRINVYNREECKEELRDQLRFVRGKKKVLIQGEVPEPLKLITLI